jgi:hypothetical protein
MSGGYESNKLGIDEDLCNKLFSPQVLFAFDRAAEFADECGSKYTHSCDLFLSIVELAECRPLIEGFIAPPYLRSAVALWTRPSTKTINWGRTSRRFHISTNGRLSCNWAASFAAAAKRQTVFPVDVLVALLLHESGSARLVLEDIEPGVTESIFTEALGTTDIPFAAIEAATRFPEALFTQALVREVPTPPS